MSSLRDLLLNLADTPFVPFWKASSVYSILLFFSLLVVPSSRDLNMDRNQYALMNWTCWAAPPKCCLMRSSAFSITKSLSQFTPSSLTRSFTPIPIGCAGRFLVRIQSEQFGAWDSAMIDAIVFLQKRPFGVVSSTIVFITEAAHSLCLVNAKSCHGSWLSG